MMNTSRPLFRNNVRLRRAINFVIDRRSLARAYSDAPLFSARPTDQYLPPAMPGFRDVHLYPVAAPDVPRAQSLARRSIVLRRKDSPCSGVPESDDM